MSNGKNIIWLASYPKSGNTWTRIFLANYLMNADRPVPINQLHRIGIGDAVAKMYQRPGVPYNPDDHAGHLKLRPQVLRRIAANGADINFVKTHNINGPAFGQALIDPTLTRGAVYIVRDPRDIVLSYGRHYAMTPSETCRAISRTDNTVAGDANSVAQYLGTWSDHVTGWTSARGFPVHTIRYEDMHAEPERIFGGLLEFIGIPVETARLDKAIRFSSFEETSRQEEKTAFIERARDGQKFFHSGTSGQWRDQLAPEDVAVLEKAHRRVMKKHGYL